VRRKSGQRGGSVDSGFIPGRKPACHIRESNHEVHEEHEGKEWEFCSLLSFVNFVPFVVICSSVH
jgi:hypothetical protein